MDMDEFASFAGKLLRSDFCCYGGRWWWRNPTTNRWQRDNARPQLAHAVLLVAMQMHPEPDNYGIKAQMEKTYAINQIVTKLRWLWLLDDMNGLPCPPRREAGPLV